MIRHICCPCETSAINKPACWYKPIMSLIFAEDKLTVTALNLTLTRFMKFLTIHFIHEQFERG